LSLCGALSTDLTALGPFFAVETHLRGAGVPAPWQPMSVLIADTDVMAARVVVQGVGVVDDDERH